MKRILFLLYILAAIIFDLSAQVNKYSVPMVRNYITEITQGSEQNWCITKDKFVGEHRRKFMKKNFKRLILDLQNYPMNIQKERFEKNLLDWRGPMPKIDDILVMGIKLNE